MKKSYNFLILIIFLFLISCQNDQELTELENNQNELTDLLKSEMGDIDGENIYLLPASLDADELLYRLMLWTDGDNKILILGELENNALQEISGLLNHHFGGVYQTEKKYDLITSAEKIQIRDGMIVNRQEFQDFKIE